MSRCFPYPPPGYEGKSRDEAQIESLKLQREKDKAKKEKKEKKEKKIEKKEKEKEKREKKEKSKEYGKSEDKKHGSEERGKDRRSQINQERVDHKKRKHENIEQVERSSVTEEHGQPAATPSLYDSSDSTQSSAKRKKHDLDAAEAGHNQGSGLRIRLPLLKRKDPELSCNTEQACHSGRADHLATGPEIASKFQPGNTVRACSSRRTDYLVEEPKTACALPRNGYLRGNNSAVKEPNSTKKVITQTLGVSVCGLRLVICLGRMYMLCHMQSHTKLSSRQAWIKKDTAISKWKAEYQTISWMA